MVRDVFLRVGRLMCFSSGGRKGLHEEVLGYGVGVWVLLQMCRSMRGWEAKLADCKERGCGMAKAVQAW